MIISRLQALAYRRLCARSMLAFSSSSTQISTHIRADLTQKLQSLNIPTQKSIIIEQILDQPDSGQPGQSTTTKKNKHIFRVLTPQQKQQLGVMIPQPAFPLRLTKELQKQYRKQLCEDLYKAQKQNLITSVRILQLQNTKANIDEYINCSYKDIFARYMLARGVGIEWDSDNSRLGVLNQRKKDQVQTKKQIVDFYRWVCELLQQYPLTKKQVLGLYSYATKKYVPIAKVDVENVYRIGYFYTMPLTKFGKFQQSFQTLKQRKQSIDLLVMLQDPLKLLNIQAICIQPNKKMIILSKYEPSIDTDGSGEQSSMNSYLITSMDVYTDHKEYFDNNGYVKHSLFDSEYLLEMEVCDGIKVYNEIGGYSRKGGAYVVDRFSGLPDFQRAHQLQLKAKHSYISEQGTIMYDARAGRDAKADKDTKADKDNKAGRDTKADKDSIMITDPKHQQKFIQKYLLQQHRYKSSDGIKKIDLYSTYQDQIFSINSQKLHFKIAQKYILPITSKHKEELLSIIQKSVLQESKVKIPKLKRSYPKPRDKRRHKKQIRELSKQQTEYMSLKDSLQSFQELSFSQIDHFGSFLTMPLIVAEAKDGGQNVVMNGRVREVVLQSLEVNVQINQNTEIQANENLIKWNMKHIQKYVQQLVTQNQKHECQSKLLIKQIILPRQLLNGFRCLRNYASRPQLSNIVVQPQSKTQDVVPYFFYLHLLLQKMITKRTPRSERGRRTSTNKTLKKIQNKMFSLIKFHPTIDESQRNRQIQQILFGVVKANNEQQYGYGLQAVRLWIARKDSYLGDRKLSDKQINKQLQLSSFIRKLYWQIIPLMNINLDKIIVEQNQQQIQLHSSQSVVPRQKLSYLHNFILDHIKYYTINMEECYTKLDLSKAIAMTQDFFRNYLDQIFVKTIRKRILAFPLSSQTKQHIYVLRKILDLLAVVAPLLPYSSFHISKSQTIAWPQWQLDDVHPQLIPNYNRMTKLRVEVRNKFMLNDFKHSEMVIPVQMVKQGEDSSKDLSDIWKLSKDDLELFFGIENISLKEPKQLGKAFQLKLTQDHPMGKVPSIKFYQYKQVCMRCSPNHHYGTHICEKCLKYLNNNFGRKLPLN